MLTLFVAAKVVGTLRFAHLALATLLSLRLQLLTDHLSRRLEEIRRHALSRSG
jgi:hypothetical protein